MTGPRSSRFSASVVHGPNDGLRFRQWSKARKGEIPIAQVAKGFGITESCLRRWLAQDDVEAGIRSGVTKAENEELKKAKRRVRELEMENEVLRRAAAYLSQANLKLGQSPQ